MGAVFVEPEALVRRRRHILPVDGALAHWWGTAVGSRAIGGFDVAVLVGIGRALDTHHAADARRHGWLLGFE